LLPKENCFDNIPKIKIKNLSEKWSIPKEYNQLTLEQLIRKLRNSVAHADYNITDKEITFTGEDYLIIFSISEMHGFFKAFGHYLLKGDIGLKELD
jgi:hypothetical protein